MKAGEFRKVNISIPCNPAEFELYRHKEEININRPMDGVGTILDRVVNPVATLFIRIALGI
jgi:hypothetical protein